MSLEMDHLSTFPTVGRSGVMVRVPQTTPSLGICSKDLQDSAYSHIHGYDLLQ